VVVVAELVGGQVMQVRVVVVVVEDDRRWVVVGW
jgi:hypothetical protein